MYLMSQNDIPLPYLCMTSFTEDSLPGGINFDGVNSAIRVDGCTVFAALQSRNLIHVTTVNVEDHQLKN